MSSEAVVNNPELLAIHIIAKFEGFSATPYECPGGHKTIGYGFSDPEIVARGSMTRQEADKILGKMVRSNLAFIKTRLPKLTVKQQAVVCSFIHNFGRQGFLDSQFYQKLKVGNIASARTELKRWVHIKIWNPKQNKYIPTVSNGLIRRREYECRYL